MPKKFKCKALFGIGITSITDFVTVASKQAIVKKEGMSYVTPSTYVFPKSKLVVFSSIKEVIRFHKDITSKIVVVVSDVPSLLKDLPGCVPLDYDQQRSFEFNFKGLDILPVIRALKAKKSEPVVCTTVSFDNLGYFVEKVKSSGDFINSYMSVTSSLPIDARKKLRDSIVTFFLAKKPNTKGIIKEVNKLSETYELIELKSFISLLESQAESYHAAINSELASAVAAKKFNVDAYAISYFKKILRSNTITNNRDARNNVSKSKNT